MLSRLPITFAQLRSGNNSQKLKNKIRQLLYSLYCSKKIAKVVCNSLIKLHTKMETIFKNTENSKKNKSHIFKLILADKLDLRNPNEDTALANLRIYYTWKNIKYAYNNNKFKTSPANWNDRFDLPDGSYSISDIQHYFEYIIKKHETIANNPPLQIYTNQN